MALYCLGMLQAHSLLWHYLWVAPSVLLLMLGFGLWRQGVHRQHPFFLAFVLASAVEQLTLYVLDITPSVEPLTWWRFFWGGLIIESILKFALLSEIFAHVFRPYVAIATLGKRLIGLVGIVLIFASSMAAAFAPVDSLFGIVSGGHLLQQTIYIIECGILVSIFGFSWYFRIGIRSADRGIALGLSVSACVHLATWALVANSSLPDESRVVLDFINMTTFHVCVLMWIYYLLVPRRVSAKTAPIGL
ncbi:MAG: hypothetical protein ACM3WP_07320, partial [Acidobacteriota bacterium]